MAKTIQRGAAANAPAPKADLPPDPKPPETPPAADAAPAVTPASPDSVQAVDPESDDYKAGMVAGEAGVDTGSADFLAGYAAGKADEKAEPADPAPPGAAPPAATTTAAPAAKVSELRAAFPDDSDIVFTALEKNWTVTEAKAHAYTKAQAKVADLSGKLARATSGQAAVATAGGVAEVKAEAGERPTDDDPAKLKAWAKAKAKAEWDAKDPQTAGFSTEERYVNVRAAMECGQLTRPRLVAPAK